MFESDSDKGVRDRQRVEVGGEVGKAVVLILVVDSLEWAVDRAWPAEGEEVVQDRYLAEEP
ncbi:Uncharacterised protein [Mycobacteroides abscessus subsp. massiliense]|nr:Uncharacterised protein [Mycobacteroides abscessus subsp. massiliense]